MCAGTNVRLRQLLITVAEVGEATADDLKTVTIVDADRLKTWIDQGKKILLIDSRVASEYKEGHIPTAINIPAPVMDQQRTKLPKDRSYPIVFYCNGWPECKKSHDACQKAIQWGYTQIYWFRDGIPAWQAKRYPVE